MKTDPKPASAGNPPPARSLTTVLEKSERARDLVEESADELSSVNTALKREIAEGDASPAVEEALEKNEGAESKVQEAVEELAVVNQALAREVHEKELLEHHLATVMDQEDAANTAAMHDPLTGLPTRALFADRLAHGLEQSKRHGWNLAVMIVDLDGMEIINDAHGHDVGDSVLKEIAGRLREITRGEDTLSRRAGDEFMYLLTEVRDEQFISSIAQTALTAIRLPCVVRGGDAASLTVGANIGIAIFPKNGKTAAALVRAADQATSRAKQEQSGYAFAG